TVTPLLCYKALKPERHADPNSKKITDRMQIWAQKLLDSMDNFYESTLRSALRHRKVVVFGILIVSGLSFFLFKFIGTEFFPESDESQFTVSVKLPVGTRIEETEK